LAIFDVSRDHGSSRQVVADAGQHDCLVRDHHVGHPDIAREVAGDALPRLTDSGTRGEANMVIGDALFAQGRDVEAAEALADAAAALAADPAASADALLAALNAAIWAGPAEARKIAMIPLPSPPGPAARVSDLLLAGYQARCRQRHPCPAAGEEQRRPLRPLIRRAGARRRDGQGVKSAIQGWQTLRQPVPRPPHSHPGGVTSHAFAADVTPRLFAKRSQSDTRCDVIATSGAG
jgi:hypothetical protein